MRKHKQFSVQQKILKNNLSKISNYNPILAKKLSNHDITANYQFEASISEESVLFKDNAAMDDTIDPVWFASDCYNKLLYKEKQSITVILGVDSGYILKEFAGKYKGKIILHEPDMDNIKVISGLIDFPQELEIMVTNTYEDIEKAFLALFSLNTPLNIIHAPYYSSNKQFIKEFDDKVINLYEMFKSNYVNLFQNNPTRTLLTFQNIPHIVESQDLHELENSFRNKPAVIISAGPSLDKNIKDLKPFRDKIVLFCVGTALKTTIKHGIIPDFAVAVETSPNMKTQLDIPEIEDINVIAFSTAYSEIFDLKPKRFLNYYGNTTPVVKWLGEALNVPTQKYHEAGTVSLTAFYSAKMLGFDKIIFIGQDLAYTDNKCYSSDSIYGDYKLNFFKKVNVKSKKETAKSVNVAENIVDDHIKMLGQNLVKVKGQNGKYLLTRPDFSNFIKYFEKVANEYGKELKLVNSTEGGAFLEGFEHIPLKEALSKYTSSDSIDVENILKNHELSAKKIQRRKEIIKEKMHEIVNNYNIAYEIISNSVKNNILPFFKQEINDISLKERAPSYAQISSKLLKNSPLVSEKEVQFCLETNEIINKWREALKANVSELYEESKDDFYKNFNLVKNDFVRINKILENNPYIKNLSINEFYLINEKIKNLEEDDKESIIALSAQINDFIVLLHNFSQEYIKIIPD